MRHSIEQRAEQSKVMVRWVVAAGLLSAVAYLKSREAVPISWGAIVALTSAASLLNLFYWYILRRSAPPWLKYVTTGTDVALISLLGFFTGGSASAFHVAYYIVLVSNSIRYGLGMALYVATIYNIGYVAVLSLRPPGGDLTIEAVKILAFWAVALYAGYLAMRFQRQGRILESYEETIARLRSELAAQPGAGRAAAPPLADSADVHS